MKAKSDPPDSLVFECDFEEPPEKVWRALTEPKLLEAWLAVERNAGHPGSSDYDVLAAEPHRLVRYRWRDRDGEPGDSRGREVHSVVTVELTPWPMGGTHLRLTHGEFRIVSAVTSIMSARRRRTATLPFAVQSCLRRAA